MSTSIHFYHPGSQGQLLCQWIWPDLAKWWSLEAEQGLENLQPWVNPDTTSHNLNRQHKYPSLPRGCFWVRTPSLNQRVRHPWTFSQHTTLLLWLTFKVRTSGYKLMKDSNKANAAALGLTKMQCSFQIDPQNPNGHIQAIPSLWG